MTILSIIPNPDTLTITIVTEHAAPPARVWQLWADPRQLERWWGPPTWPATVTEHALTAGGRVAYYMTGPDGETAGGSWTVIAADPPHWLEFEDLFADADGAPDLTMPVTRSRITLEPAGAGTRVTIVSTFADAAQMQQLLEMGVIEGTTEAMGQMDAVLDD